MYQKRLSTVQSIACFEGKRKWRWSLTIVKTVKFIAQQRIFNSEKATISFYVQTPNEVMNRIGVVHIRCWNESDSLHV